MIQVDDKGIYFNLSYFSLFIYFIIFGSIIFGVIGFIVLDLFYILDPKGYDYILYWISLWVNIIGLSFLVLILKNITNKYIIPKIKKEQMKKTEKINYKKTSDGWKKL